MSVGKFDLDYELLSFDDEGKAAGIIVDGNLTVNRTLVNMDWDDGPFLIVTGNVKTKNLVVSGSEVYIKGKFVKLRSPTVSSALQICSTPGRPHCCNWNIMLLDDFDFFVLTTGTLYSQLVGASKYKVSLSASTVSIIIAIMKNILKIIL